MTKKNKNDNNRYNNKYNNDNASLMQPPGPVWTLEAWIQHAEAMREDDQRALEIKQKADEEALNLARNQQTYKDEKANELREQISSERGHYIGREEYNIQHGSLNEKVDASAKSLDDKIDNGLKALNDKVDSNFKVINDFMSSQQGQKVGSTRTQLGYYYGGIILLGIVDVLVHFVH